MHEEVELVRPWWHHKEYHEKKLKDVTVLICQRKTKDLITLCLESLLNYYPDVNVLVVDGDSQDDSSLYLKFKSTLYPNVQLWDRKGVNSHGVTMDEAIKSRIQTKYVLLMDSDVIMIRPGMIEGMIVDMELGFYATGALMRVTRENYAIGLPKNEDDVLEYIHPSTGMYDVEKYKKMSPFVDHGAPCVYNMIDAADMGYGVCYFPTDKYVAHLSGASWCIPKPIWPHSFNVRPIPPVTFILNSTSSFEMLNKQTNKWFDIMLNTDVKRDHIVMHEFGERQVNNNVYENRIVVTGEYICELFGTEVVSHEFMKFFLYEIIKFGDKDELLVEGVKFVKRNVWQLQDALR